MLNVQWPRREQGIARRTREDERKGAIWASMLTTGFMVAGVVIISITSGLAIRAKYFADTVMSAPSSRNERASNFCYGACRRWYTPGVFVTSGHDKLTAFILGRRPHRLGLAA